MKDLTHEIKLELLDDFKENGIFCLIFLVLFFLLICILLFLFICLLLLITL